MKGPLVPAAGRAGLLAACLLLQSCTGFHMGLLQTKAGFPSTIQQQMGRPASRSFTAMSMEKEGSEGAAGWADRIKEGMGKEWSRVLFGVGTAVGAGYTAPEATQALKAVRDGQDAGSVLREVLRPPSAEAISFKPFSRRTLKEKLASVPCFMVCNRAGNPYLVPLSSGFDVGVVFLDPKDAEEMMQNMVQNPATADARVMAMGLDKGLQLVQQEPRPNGQHLLVFQFCPSVKQLQNACGFRKIGWKVLEKGQEKWRWGFNRQGVKNAGIPIFYCPDLRIMKGGQLVKTFFFSLEDLYYAWDRSNHGLDQDNPQVMTLDFLRALEWMMNEPQESRLVGFHADTQAQEYVEQGLKLKGGKVKTRR